MNKRKPGAVRTAAPGTTKYSSKDHGPTSGRLSLLDYDAESFRATVDAVIEEGDCFLISKTTDGGAISIRVLSEGLVEKWYPNNVEELRTVLEGIFNALDR